MRKFTLVLFLVLFCQTCFSQDNGLPRYLTEQEKQMFGKYNHPSQISDPNPPPPPVRTMAEWEECQGIIITWTQFTAILRQIVDYAQDEGLVYIVCTDSNAVRTYLTGGGVPLINLRFILTNFNSIWCRDYGPWAVYSGAADSLRLVDWIYNRPRPLDDVISVTFGNYTSTPVHQTINAPNDLVNTGGNFMVDGHGTAFASRLILSENAPGNPYGVTPKTEAEINSIMNSYMGISRYIKMDILPYDVIHHIDMHIKLLDEETLLVGQYPTGVADGPQIEANLQYVLNNFPTCFNKPYKVVRILMPPGPNGQYPPNDNYRTYTNSLIINRTVIMPTYEYRYDTTAFRVYREAMPGYNVVGIDCNQIIPSLGAIHCITKEIGIRDNIFISHSALRNTSNITTPYEVKAYIKTKSGVSSARIFWTIDTNAGYIQVPMTQTGDTFRANIPAQPLNTKVYYYISANSVSGRTVTKPLPSPRGAFRFTVTNVLGITQNNIPESFKLFQNYPNPFNPVTKIEFNIAKLSLVQLRIFDITGKEAAVLLNQYMQAGNYKTDFDASNYPSGVYFYKLETANFADVKKMILVK